MGRLWVAINFETLAAPLHAVEHRCVIILRNACFPPGASGGELFPLAVCKAHAFFTPAEFEAVRIASTAYNPLVEAD